MNVSSHRYRELVAAGRRPRCRKNGCISLVGHVGSEREGVLTGTLRISVDEERSILDNRSHRKLKVRNDESWRKPIT